MASEFEFVVMEKENKRVIATFDNLENTCIFVDAYFNRYYLEEGLCLTVERRLRGQ